MLEGSEILHSQSLPALKRQTIFTGQGQCLICQDLSFGWDQFKQLLRCFIPCQHRRHEASAEDEAHREDVLHSTVIVAVDEETVQAEHTFKCENVSIIRDFIRECLLWKKKRIKKKQQLSIDISLCDISLYLEIQRLLLHEHKLWL